MHRLETHRESDVVLITAGGELDAFAAADLSGAFAQVVGNDRVVVDLEGVSFLDSTALGLVVRALRDVDDRGWRGTIVLPRGAARRIFEITTLDRVLPVAPSRAQALADLADLVRGSP